MGASNSRRALSCSGIQNSLLERLSKPLCEHQTRSPEFCVLHADIRVFELKKHFNDVIPRLPDPFPLLEAYPPSTSTHSETTSLNRKGTVDHGHLVVVDAASTIRVEQVKDLLNLL